MLNGAVRALIVTAVLIGLAAPASAQVGHQPDRSPYRDRDYNREWTYFGGTFSAEKDPVGVAPTDGPVAGVRWQMHMTGPLYFGVRLAGGSIDRTVIDPAKRIAERTVGTEKVPMAFADIGLEMSLTGHKTWRGLAPFINGGLGVAADLRGENDVGSYRFGIPFTMTLGTGVSWTPARNWSVRLDWSHYLYRIQYPTTYYLKVTEDPAVLPVGAARSFWRRNPSLTLGVTLFRPR
jgi:opacity protein-like surface antigen